MLAHSVALVLGAMVAWTRTDGPWSAGRWGNRAIRLDLRLAAARFTSTASDPMSTGWPCRGRDRDTAWLPRHSSPHSRRGIQVAQCEADRLSERDTVLQLGQVDVGTRTSPRCASRTGATHPRARAGSACLKALGSELFQDHAVCPTLVVSRRGHRGTVARRHGHVGQLEGCAVRGGLGLQGVEHVRPRRAQAALVLSETSAASPSHRPSAPGLARS